MLFPFHCQAGKVQSAKQLHKLTSMDICTNVLVPTQAYEFTSI